MHEVMLIFIREGERKKNLAVYPVTKARARRTKSPHQLFIIRVQSLSHNFIYQLKPS